MKCDGFQFSERRCFVIQDPNRSHIESLLTFFSIDMYHPDYWQTKLQEFNVNCVCIKLIAWLNYLVSPNTHRALDKTSFV